MAYIEDAFSLQREVVDRLASIQTAIEQRYSSEILSSVNLERAGCDDCSSSCSGGCDDSCADGCKGDCEGTCSQSCEGLPFG